MPFVAQDLTGMKFGKLTVIKRSEENDRQGKPMWICSCSCGNIKAIRSSVLLKGQAKSCKMCKGFSTPLYVRNHANRLYHTWSGIIQRCKGNCTSHEYYFEKGISVCKEWLDFDMFAKWAIENGYGPGLEIDRIDSDRDYSPDNCRWVTHKKNSRNRKARSNNTTGTPGVQPRKYRSGRIVYRVSIETDDGRVNVGTFEDLDSAVAARKNAELEYWGFNIGE